MKKKENSLKSVETHFEFGKNWASYAKGIKESQIEEAKACILALMSQKDIEGKTVLDIGCGSGLSSLAFLTLGAKEVVAVDIDPVSVQTTKAVLDQHWKDKNYWCGILSVFDLLKSPQGQKTYDIVYSWGVLHHTGDMYAALKIAGDLVAPKGKLFLALYYKTKYCPQWVKIKKFYSHSNKFIQKIIQLIYIFLFALRKFSLGENYFQYVKEYRKSRGMSYSHDVHDWLGGYPYESISSKELSAYMSPLGFEIYKEELLEGPNSIFGCGCNEFVLTRVKN